MVVLDAPARAHTAMIMCARGRARGLDTEQVSLQLALSLPQATVQSPADAGNMWKTALFHNHNIHGHLIKLHPRLHLACSVDPTNPFYKSTIPAPESKATTVKAAAKYLPMPNVAPNTWPVASLFLLVEVPAPPEPEPEPADGTALPAVAAAITLEQLPAAPAALMTCAAPPKSHALESPFCWP